MGMLLHRLGQLALFGVVATAGVVGVSSAATATSAESAPAPTPSVTATATPTSSVTSTVGPDLGIGDNTPGECEQHQPGADATEEELADAEALYRACMAGRDPNPIEDGHGGVKPGKPDTGDENTPG